MICERETMVLVGPLTISVGDQYLLRTAASCVASALPMATRSALIWAWMAVVSGDNLVGRDCLLGGHHCGQDSG